MSAVEVSESEAAFLEEASRSLSRLAQEVAAFPPRTWLDFGSSWGQQFEPIYARLQDIKDRGLAYLAPGSTARAQFTAAITEFNKMLGVAQNQDEGWLDAASRFARDPLAFSWRAAKSIAAAEAEGAALYAEQGATYVGDKVAEGVGEAARAAGKYGLWALGAAALVGVLLLAGGRR